MGGLARKAVEGSLAGGRFEVPVSQAPKWAREMLRGWEAELLALSAAKRRKAARVGDLFSAVRGWQDGLAEVEALPRRQVRLFFAAIAGVLIRRLDLDPTKSLMVRYMCGSAVDQICDGLPPPESAAARAATAADSDPGRASAPGEPSDA